MNIEMHNSIVKVIEKTIESKINDMNSCSWRKIKERKFHLVFDSLDCLIYYIRKVSSLVWVKEEKNSFSVQEQDELYYHFSELGIDKYANEINIAFVYQQLLADDLSYLNNKYYFIVDKHQRDNLGSYFTPAWLAYNLTLKVVNKYLVERTGYSLNSGCKKNNFLDVFLSLKVVDLSVGGGVFLKAYIQIVKRFITNDPKDIYKILSQVYGVDVDPIALLICKHELSIEIGGEFAPVNLIFANPLITEPQYQMKNKLNSIAEGRIYNSCMGIDIEKFSSVKFDLILGNPPWEKVRFEERKFFKQRYPEISEISKKNDRKKAIAELKKSNLEDYIYYQEFSSDYEKIRKIFKNNSLIRYSLSGEINTYSLFYELAFNLLSENGVVGLLVKSSMVKTPANKDLFNFLVENGHLSEIDLMKNTKKIFDIDSREEFAFVISSKTKKAKFIVSTGITGEEDLHKNSTSLILEFNLLKKLNPDTKMLPNINNLEELDFLVCAHKDNPLFSDVFPKVTFGRLVHFTSHADYIEKESNSGVPVYEGKFIERYDSMFATFKGMRYEDRYKPKASALIQNNENKEIPECRYFINKNFWEQISKNYNQNYTVMWRSLTSTTNKRTMLATIMPFVPTSQSIQFLQTLSEKESIIILAIFNSVIFDYLVRLKMPGIDLTQTVIKSIPVPYKECFDKIIEFKNIKLSFYEHILSRIAWLYRNDARLSALFVDKKIEYFGVSDKKCNSELDILIGTLYNMSLEQIKKIAGKFPAYYTDRELELFF